jgi:Transglutaminase-like superfamily
MPSSERTLRFFTVCAEACVLVPLFAVALRVAPGLVLRHVRQRTLPHGANRPDLAARVASAVQRATAWLPARAATCLPLACASHVMLARRGAVSHLRIGVAKTARGMTAHAWVEAGGIVIGGAAPSPSFVALPIL